MAMPQWVVDQMQSTYDPSQMVSTGPAPLPEAFQTPEPGMLTPEQQAAIQAAYGGGGIAPGVPAGGISEQQYLEQAAAEENARRNQPAPLPPALQAVTPFPQAQPQMAQPAQPAQLIGPPAAPEQQAPELGNLGMLAAMYARGNQRVIPEAVVKAAEQWKQQGPAAMPGDVAKVIPNQPLPGVDDPTPLQMGNVVKFDEDDTPLYRSVIGTGKNAKIILESYPDRFVRLSNENAQRRAHNVQPSQYDQARAAREEFENEALLDQRADLMQQADRADEAARSEYLRGRGYADRLVQNENEQRERGVLIDSRVSELDRLIEQRSSIQATNPVKDYWSSMSGWGRFATALSLGLGAAGQALAGGQNVALELVNREIDGEIQKQRAQVDSLGTTIAAKRSLLGDMLSKFRDPAAADHAARSALLGMAESQYRAQAAREKSAELKNQMTLLADQLALQRAAAKEAALGGERTALWAWQPARVVGTPGGLAGLTQMAKDYALTPQQEQQMKLEYAKGGPQAADAFLSGIKSKSATMDRNEVAQARFDMEHKIILADGSIGYVKDKGDYEKNVTSLDMMKSNLGRLQKYVLSGSPWSPTDRANVDAIASMATGEIRIVLGLGVMSESDKELAAKLTGYFVNDRISVADKLARLETLQSLVEQKRRMLQERVTKDPNANEKAEPTIVTRKVR